MKKLSQLLKRSFIGYLALYAHGVRMTSALGKFNNQKDVSLADIGVQGTTIIGKVNNVDVVLVTSLDKETVDIIGQRVLMSNIILDESIENYIRDKCKAGAKQEDLELIMEEIKSYMEYVPSAKLPSVLDDSEILYIANLPNDPSFDDFLRRFYKEKYDNYFETYLTMIDLFSLLNYKALSSLVKCLPKSFDYNYAQIKSKPTSYMIEITKNGGLNLEEKATLINLLISKGSYVNEIIQGTESQVKPYSSLIQAFKALIIKEKGNLETINMEGELRSLYLTLLNNEDKIQDFYSPVSTIITTELSKNDNTTYLIDILKDNLISEKLIKIQNPIMNFLLLLPEGKTDENGKVVATSADQLPEKEIILFSVPLVIHKVYQCLIEAIFNGDKNLIKNLLTKNVVENFPTELGTPLHVAAYAKNQDIYNIIAGNKYINYKQLDGNKRVASEILDAPFKTNNIINMLHYYKQHELQKITKQDFIVPATIDYIFKFLQDVFNITRSKNFEILFGNKLVKIGNANTEDVKTLLSSNKEEYLHNLSAKYITTPNRLRELKNDDIINLEVPYKHSLKEADDITFELRKAPRNIKYEDTSDSFAKKKSFYEYFQEFGENHPMYAFSIMTLLVVIGTYLKNAFFAVNAKANAKESMLDELTHEIVPGRWKDVAGIKFSKVGFSLDIPTDSAIKYPKLTEKELAEIIINALVKIVKPHIEVKYKDRSISLIYHYNYKSMCNEIFLDNFFIDDIETKIPTVRQKMIKAISIKEKQFSKTEKQPTSGANQLSRVENSAVAEIKPVSYVLLNKGSFASSSSSIKQPILEPINRGAREAKNKHKSEEIQKRIEEKRKNTELKAEQKKAADLAAEQDRQIKKEEHRAKKIAEKAAKEQAIKASIEIKEKDNKIALQSSKSMETRPTELLPKIDHYKIAAMIKDLENTLACDMSVNTSFPLEKALHLKLDATQYLVITLIEDTKAFANSDIRRLLKDVRGCLAKDLYMIEDRKLEINLHELEGFSILLINYARCLIQPGHDGEVDFLTDPFSKYVKKNVSHGLSKDIPDRDKMLIGSIEEIFSKIKEYSLYINSPERNYAIYHNIGLIGGIRKQFSEKFKETNGYFFDNIIDYGYTRARNKIFHGAHIKDKELKNFIKQTEDVLGILSGSINAKHHFEAPLAAPVFINDEGEMKGKGKGKISYIDADQQDQSLGTARRFINHENKNKGKGKEMSHVNSYYQSRSSIMEKHL